MADCSYQHYRNQTLRLPNRDYGKTGIYFVTICTAGRRPFFGMVTGDLTHLSPMGQIAHDCWQAIPRHHSHVALDEFVVMPNHVHGLIKIVQATSDSEHTTNQFGPLQKGALPAIVQSYKAAVTRLCRRRGYAQFKWQPRYYEHIVRRDGSLNRIRQYIVDNPRKWHRDLNHPDDVWM